METKTTILSVLFFCCLAALGVPCPKCGVSMLEGDNFCQNCGTPRKSMDDQKQENQEYANLTPSRSSSPQEQWHPASYGNRSASGFFAGVGERLLGMGRGLVTAAFSPLNIVRGMVTGCVWIEASGFSKAGGEAILYGSPFFISVGAVMGSFATCADAINGSLDLATVGYYGDWLYDAKVNGKPTPWVWDRKWNTSSVPWINREE